MGGFFNRFDATKTSVTATSVTSDDLEIDSGTLSIDATNNKVGVGLTAPKTKLTVEGAITLKEQADADSDTADYGQIWVNTATPNQLYFTTDAGDDIQLTSGTSVVGPASAVSMANGSDNRITTATGAAALNGEANLTFDSKTLAVATSVKATAATFTDATCDYNDDPTVTMDSTALLQPGWGVTGTGIPAGAGIASITDATTFELTAATTGGSVTNGTLTFHPYAAGFFGGGMTSNNVVRVSADSLTTGGLLSLTSNSSSTGNRTLLTVHNDNTAAVGVQMVHLLNDAVGGDGDPILLVESSAAETEAILELRNSNTATDKPSLLRFYRTQWNEADDMSLGSVSFQAVDSTNTKTEYATIDVIATDITDGDEAGKITFNVFAGGRAGTAAAANLFSIGGEDQAADVQCEVVVNEAGIDCDFRVEGDSVTNLLFVEASSDTVTFGGDVTIGGATPKLTIGDAGAEDTMLVFDGAAADWRVGIDDGTDVLEIGVGAAHGTTTAIGINANAQTQVLAAFGANVAGSFGTFADGDATPPVGAGNLWKTEASVQTITMFDGGIAGQVINVISTAAITYDVTSTNLIGGSTDIVTASGDVTQWFFDGTNWYLTYFMDASADHSVIGGGGSSNDDLDLVLHMQVFS